MQYENTIGDGELLGKESVIGLGNNRLFLCVTAAHKTSYREVRLSLVGQHSDKPSVFDTAKINGVHVKLPPDKWSQGGLSSNCVYVSFKPAYTRLPKDKLHLVVEVRCKEPWTGYVVFQSERDDKHLGETRVKLSVI